MPRLRWFTCPVVEEHTTSRSGEHGKRRWAKIADMPDPSKPDGAGGFLTYNYSAAISSGLEAEENDWCLVVVTSEDFGPIDEDPDFVEVTGKDAAELEQKLSTLGRRVDPGFHPKRILATWR